MFNTNFRSSPSTRLGQFLAASFFCILASGCGPSGSGILVDEEHSFDAYDSIVLANGFEGSIVIGDEFSVRITADDNLIDFVHTHYLDGEVLVEFDKNSYRDATLRAEFTLPRVASIVVEDGSSMDARGVEAEDRLELTARDGSEMTFSLANDQTLERLILVAVDGASIDFEGQSEAAKLTLEDGASVDMEGGGTSMDLTMRDGSSLSAQDYPVEELNCSLSDGASAKVRVSEEAEGSLNDGSSLEIWGDGRSNIDVSDGSSIKHR